MMQEQMPTVVRAWLGGKVSTARSTQTSALATRASMVACVSMVLQSTAVHVHPAGVVTTVIRMWINALARRARTAELVLSISSASEPTRARTYTCAPVAQDSVAQTVRLTSTSAHRIRATTAAFVLNQPQTPPLDGLTAYSQALGNASVPMDGWVNSVGRPCRQRTRLLVS